MIGAYWQMHDMGTGWWLLMSAGWIVLWAFAIWALVVVLRRREERTPREILDRRLAEGEITVEDYERLRDAMRSTAKPGSAHAYVHVVQLSV
jgi:putative membrane protein